MVVIDEPFNLVVNNPTILYNDLIKNKNLFIKTMYGDNPLEFENMSAKEFASHMLEACSCEMGDDELPTVTSYAAGKFHPHPPEVIKYITVLPIFV